MQTKNASSTVASAIVANQSATFTVTGLECCPPSVIVDLISKVTGVSKVDIEPLGSKGKVTVSFDDQKTDVKKIQSSVTKYGFGVIGG
ncbi:mercury resistance system substrate-binding protein MerP [Gordoniibacillus kamchatkensis]|uniref:mercury resistance system substrate-binding protein MerP n=1 Tax=Gordoniibacillus kamchatkensis TaxID=1590651 RepID=UPI0012E07D70|nr:mercury resistance system substrate-binding protein MerP [Paenibacillus sp. VKM B-2647]